MEYIIGLGIILFILYKLGNSESKEGINDTPKPIPTVKPKPKFVLTKEFEEILRILKNSSDSIFITGKAGTGKTSLLKHFIKRTNKKYVILAPTGIAALNVSGQTIHSFFRFPPKTINTDDIEPNYVRAGMFGKLEMVIIDEISMVRADLMHGIDYSLRINRNRLNEPFGGVQMVFIGDLFQLPPVLTDRDRNHILSTYGGQYFFDAPAFSNYSYHFKELTKVFRQSESETKFKNLLNNVRENEVGFDDMVLLNSRHIDNAGKQDNAIFLTTRRNIARNINNEKLNLLPTQQYVYKGELSGKYIRLRDESEEKLENKLPAPYNLKLKVGVQIMMLKNDAGKRWVNGTIGKVSELNAESIIVDINGRKHSVEKEIWKEVEYVLNQQTDEFEEKIIAGFIQYPIRLSYAMTIHKSQGKTFEKVTVDVGTGAFAHGQVYVALSRCTTLKGIILNNPIGNNDIIVDPRIVEYYTNRSTPSSVQIIETPRHLNVQQIIRGAIEANNKVKIKYEKYNGETSIRELSQLQVSNEYSSDEKHIKAYCHLRNEERNFKISRIRSIEIIK